MSISRIMILTLSISLGGCFKIPLTSTGRLDQSGSAGKTTQAVSRAVGAEKEIAEVDPDAKTDTHLTTPKVEGLSGASVVIAPGSLGINVSIVVEQASEFAETSISNEMGLASDIQVAAASPGMIIRPSENADLKKPLSLSMPLPVGLGFRLQSGSKYGIFYKYFDPTEQKLVTGLKVVDNITVKLTFDPVSGKDLISFEGYFGAYWAAILSREVTVAEIPPPKPAEEPIINKAKVAVIQNSGVVKETQIIKTQSIAEVAWARPSIKYNADSRMVSLSVAVPANQKVNSCKVDLFESATSKSGVSLESPLGPNIEYIMTNTREQSLVGRFRCTDEQARVTITPWSDVMTIPAIPNPKNPSLPTYSELDALCDPNTSGLRVREPNSNGDLIDQMAIPRVENCKFSGKMFLNGSGVNFYISTGPGDYTCGLASHNLIIGDQTLTCEKTTAANVGSNHLTLQASNYNITIDFSLSKTNPKLTLALAPCDKGDLYLQSGYSLSAATAPTEAEKMTHKGACEFEKVYTTIPWSGSASISFRNLSGNFSCGDDPSYNQLSQGSYHSNSCGPGNLRKFQFSSGGPALAHRFSVRFGESLNGGYGPSNDYSEVQYKVDSNCPDRLYIASSALGMNLDNSRNVIYRNGGCSYSMQFYAGSTTAGVYDFKVKSEDGSRVCGGSTSGSQIYLDCNAGAAAIPFNGEIDKVYFLTLNGDPISGVLNGGSSTSQSPSCDPFYLQPSVATGFTNSASTAMNETRQCVFEKLWTPSAGNLGFNLTSTNQQIYSANFNADNQPSIDGSETSVTWFTDPAQAPKIMPLNAVVGTTYRIIVDQRNQGIPQVKVESYVAANSNNCSEDLYLVSPDFGEGTPALGNRFTHHGDCNYSYTLNFPGDNSGYKLYRIINASLGQECGFQGSGINPTRYMDRMGTPYCGASVDPYNIDLQGRSVVRFFVKKSNAGAVLRFVVRDLTSTNYDWKLAGSGSIGLTEPQKTLMGPQAQAGNIREKDLIWSLGANNGFQLRNQNMNQYCIPDAAYGPLLSSPMNMTCKYLQATPPAQEFGQYSVGMYRIRLLIPDSIEENMKVSVEPYYALASFPFVQPLTDQAYAGVGYAPQPTGSLAGKTPGGLKRAATWTAANGDLFLFGGENSAGARYRSLWKFDRTTQSWTLLDGDDAPNVQSVISGTQAPGSRSGSITWTDATNNRLYLFGGQGWGNGTAYGRLSDLWYWDLNSSGWHFVRGDDTVNSGGVFPAPTDVNIPLSAIFPPSMYDASSFVDSANNFWLFGGQADSGAYDDVWKFIPTSGVDSIAGEWRWMGGSQSPNTLPGNSTWPAARFGSAVWKIDMEGSFFLYGGRNGLVDFNDMWRFQPGTYSWTRIQENNAPGYLIWENNGFHEKNRPTNSNSSKAISWKRGDDLLLYSNGGFYTFSFANKAWSLTGRNSDPWQEISNSTVDPVFNSYNFDATNQLGRRNDAMTWSSSFGNYIYGGYAMSPSSAWNDMWKIEN